MWDLWYRDEARGLSGEKLREFSVSWIGLPARLGHG
jgi:hypothetical protein